ncbi:ComEC/Rec2 family competence protein [Roseibium sp.]|uniref:ComEC/Rec2 family competence protein n=2 Tax=Roseibium sp. TaxID=1936156 RepID=UPI003264E762
MASGGLPDNGWNSSVEAAPPDLRKPVILRPKAKPAGSTASAGDEISRHGPGRSSAARRAGPDRFRDEQGLLWNAFAFASGIAIYALLPEEPSPIILAAALGGAGLAALYVAARRSAPGWRVLLLLAFFCGVTAGSLRTAAVDAPRISEPMNVSLTGQVLERRAGSSGARLVIAVATVNERPSSGLDFPEKVRVRVPSASAGRVGETIRVRARLFPPMGPVYPGGYDFSFRAYFTGIGATGFSYGPASVTGTDPGSVRMAASARVAQLREGLAGRIRSLLSDRPETALIVALLVGDRSGITEEQEAVLRAAGLAHILAISGLHMALFAGGAYGAVLLLLASVPALTLRWPIHKWAALAALAAAVVYLVLSGAAVATQRSFLMIAIVFLGILVGRRGVTLRSVAIAGLALLLIAPERLFFPGFQMSFAAVICLVAVYDLWRRRDRELTAQAARPEGLKLLMSHLAKWSAGLFITALVAGLATGIIGAHHFGRVAPYGLIGNMLGMPVFSLLVMPMGVLALVLMPFGLAGLPLAVMSFGVSVLLKIAEFTAGLDAGDGVTGRLDGVAALLLLCALFTGLLLPGRTRLCAALPLAAGILIAVGSRPPDIQVAASGGRVAARDDGGLLRFSGRKSAFLTELWFQYEGVPPDAIGSRKMNSEQRRCDPLGCVVHAYSVAGERAGTKERSVAIALPKTLEASDDDCRYADIIVSDQIVQEGCRARLVLGPEIRTSRGAVSIWLSAAEPRAGMSGQQGKERENGKAEAPTPPLPVDQNRNGLAPVISRVIYAIPDPPRPWHRQGTVTRAYLHRAVRADTD